MLDIQTLKEAYSDNGYNLSANDIECMIKKIKNESDEEQNEEILEVPAIIVHSHSINPSTGIEEGKQIE